MSEPVAPPLILFSGMGADAAVFASQQAAFPNLAVPDWIAPERGEDLASYCHRFAALLNPGEPCFVGGASFGGIVALEMTRHLETRGCFLIGSVRGPHQLPWRLRVLRPFGKAIGLIPIRALQRSAAMSAFSARQVGAEHFANVQRQFSDADIDVLRWSALQILRWRSRYDDVVVHHIHGDADHVFPISQVVPDEVVVGGGHVISMTHGEQVNEFIRSRMENS